MNNFVLWCTYHREDIPKEYNLYNSDHFKLFNDDDLTIVDDNINYLHDYLCNLTTYYYVWKNNLKSDYVGFCQYSKHFRYIDTYKLNKFGFFTYNYHYEKQQKFIDDNSEYHICKNMDYLYRNLIFYIKNKYNVDVFKYYKNHQFIYESWHNNYIFKWDIFCDVCDYIFGYLDYIFTNDKWKIKSNIDFLCKARNDDINEILYRNVYSFPKGLSIFFEWAVGLYIGIKYKLNNHCDYDDTLYNHKDYHNYIITCKDTIKNIDEFKIWVKQNIKTGIENYIIKTNFDKKYVFDSIDKIMNNDCYRLFVYNNNNEFIDKQKEFIDSNYINIELTLNERINCESSIEMHKGNYFIDKIN